jgi:uncharacterized protein YbdZ (MbtH family)
MLFRSNVDPLWMFACVLAFCVSADAQGNAFKCRHQTQGATPVLVCSDDGSPLQTTVAQVVLRKMPRWGVHAGLTVVDFCVSSRRSEQTDSSIRVDLDYGLSAKVPSDDPANVCERRYCTDEKRQFSLFINSIPIPAGWTIVSFWLGYQNRSFSIQCNELLPSAYEAMHEFQ